MHLTQARTLVLTVGALTCPGAQVPRCPGAALPGWFRLRPGVAVPGWQKAVCQQQGGFVLSLPRRAGVSTVARDAQPSLACHSTLPATSALVKGYAIASFLAPS